jgi:hypothetical protein
MWAFKGSVVGEALEGIGIHFDASSDRCAARGALKHQRTHFFLLNLSSLSEYAGDERRIIKVPNWAESRRPFCDAQSLDKELRMNEIH